MPNRRIRALVTLFVLSVALTAALSTAHADGKLMPPRDYPGSLEEHSQEAIIIFHGSEQPGAAVEELILKVSVAVEPDRTKEPSGAEPPTGALARAFGWVVPFPHPPEVTKEDARLFKECFDYVQARLVRRPTKGKLELGVDGARQSAEAEGVNVISREIVGSYDVAIVREKEPGALNRWLDREGFQTLPEGEEVIAFYRKKGYVFACMKVNDAALEAGKTVDLHPLRFTFKTGGRDGVYFPMRMTGLQTAPFNVNLYVFYRAWLNDKLNKYGYTNRGFRLRFRDWDSGDCKPNAGKNYSAPLHDPYLAPLAGKIPTLAKLFQKLHPGERYYLTNIQAWGLEPGDVRHWSDDLWLFPYYTDPDMIPYDARPGGPAAAGWTGH